MSSDATPTQPLSDDEASAGRSTIGRYQIRGVLGRGGMGVVVEAHDPELDRLVAVKILVEHGPRAELLGAALRREAQALARVTHPNVLAVYDAGVDGSPYLVMQRIDGETMGAYLARTKPTPAAIVALYLQAARGLAAIHAAGLIHRDVKPSNLLVDRDGVVHVADLGLARIGELVEHGDGAPAVPTARATTLAGTPAYMAPEQLDHRPLTPACDQFSFCVALWEALTGARPFPGATEAELVRAVRSPPPEVRVEGVPARWFAALRRGLAEDPAARFPSMDALAAALSPASSRGPRVELAAAAAAAAAGALAIAALTAGSSTGAGSSPPAPSPGAGLTADAAARPLALELADVRRLTPTDSCDEYPSLGPDGTIYYDAIVGPDQHLMALAPGASEPRTLTRTKGWDLAPQPSPDGTRLVFLRKTEEMMTAYVGRLDDLAHARPIVRGGSRPSWSPDGRFVWAGGRKGLSRYDAETLAVERTLELPTGAFPMHALELADGRVVVLTRTGSASADGLYLYERPNTPPRALIPASDDHPMEEVLAPSPLGDGVLVAKLTATNAVTIWHVPLDGSPGSVATGVIPARKKLAVAGKRLVWSDCTELLTLASVTHTPAGTTRFLELSRNPWVDFSPAAIPGTDELLFLSYRSTTDEIWRMRRDGERARVVPFGKHQLDRIAVSHDGTWVVGSNGEGLFAGPLDGSAAPVKVLAADGGEQNAVFSRDGKTLYVELRDGKADRIAAIPRASGAPTWVTPPGSLAPATSPTRDALAYLALAPGGEATLQRQIVVRELATGATRRLPVPAYPYRDLRWSPDGARLLAIRRDGELAEIDVATGRVLRRFDVGADQLFGTTYFGDEILVGRSSSAGDLWEAELR